MSLAPSRRNGLLPRPGSVRGETHKRACALSIFGGSGVRSRDTKVARPLAAALPEWRTPCLLMSVQSWKNQAKEDRCAHEV